MSLMSIRSQYDTEFEGTIGIHRFNESRSLLLYTQVYKITYTYYFNTYINGSGGALNQLRASYCVCV